MTSLTSVVANEVYTKTWDTEPDHSLDRAIYVKERPGDALLDPTHTTRVHVVVSQDHIVTPQDSLITKIVNYVKKIFSQIINTVKHLFDKLTSCWREKSKKIIPETPKVLMVNAATQTNVLKADKTTITPTCLKR